MQKLAEAPKKAIPDTVLLDYGIYLDEGYVVAVRHVNGGVGYCISRDSQEIKEGESFDDLFKKAVRWLACHHSKKFSEILQGMQKDVKYHQMARDEIDKFIDELKILMG